ncbi:unnamed protein product [Chrysoparadoxa australica]
MTQAAPTQSRRVSAPGRQQSGKRGGDASVRVVARVRPSNDKERDEGGVACVNFSSHTSIVVASERGKETYTFDAALPPSATQADVFAETAKPIVADVMQGFNGTIFAYGQTSSGKTHTMEGPSLQDQDLRGVIPRAVSEIFKEISEADVSVAFSVKVSYIEIYMERISDLIDSRNANLQVRESPARGIYVAGATEEYVASEKELLDIMEAGKRNRQVAATGMNAGSSRSHSTFIITVQQTAENESTKTGALYLVDLAGSEMVKKTNATGARLDEAKTINKSLSALGLVINALTDDKISHVPYRDSKLTRILTNSLGGNSKTCLVICCSPSSYNANETLSTCRFGARAKRIQNKAVVNETRSVTELSRLLEIMESKLRLKDTAISSLEQQLAGGVETEGGGDGTGSGAGTGAGVVAINNKIIFALQEDLTLERQKAQQTQDEIDSLLGKLAGGEEALAVHKAELLAMEERCQNLEAERDAAVAGLQAASEKHTFEMGEATLEMERLRRSLAHAAGSDREQADAVEAAGPAAGPAAEGLPQAAASVKPEPEPEQEQELDWPPAARELVLQLKAENQRQASKNVALGKDLEREMVRVMELEKLLEAGVEEGGEGGAQGQAAARHMRENVALRQRLEQLVAVHRHLLRKFAQKDLDVADYMKKVQLRDVHIQQLQGAKMALAAKLSDQAAKHMKELHTLRRQVVMANEEGGVRHSGPRIIKGGFSDNQVSFEAQLTQMRGVKAEDSSVFACALTSLVASKLAAEYPSCETLP